MKSEGVGGHNTITGLHFEAKVDLHQLLEKIPGYSLEKLPGKAGTDVYFNNNLVARLFRKYSFYDFLSEKNREALNGDKSSQNAYCLTALSLSLSVIPCSLSK